VRLPAGGQPVDAGPAGLEARSHAARLPVESVAKGSAKLCLGPLAIGVWRSLVACLVRVEEVVGSNPATPTVPDEAACEFSRRPLRRFRPARATIFPCSIQRLRSPIGCSTTTLRNLAGVRGSPRRGCPPRTGLRTLRRPTCTSP